MNWNLLHGVLILSLEINTWTYTDLKKKKNCDTRSTSAAFGVFHETSFAKVSYFKIASGDFWLFESAPIWNIVGYSKRF